MMIRRLLLSTTALRPRDCQRASSVALRLVHSDDDTDDNTVTNTDDADNADNSTQTKEKRKKREKFKIRRDLLLDATGREVFTPEVDMDLCVTENPLSQDLQRVVEEHVNIACFDHPLPHSRHIVRHWKLDSRKSLKPRKKKALQTKFTITPFVLIGAYQELLERVENLKPRTEDGLLAKQNIQDAQILFSWFATVSKKIDPIEAEHFRFQKVKLPDKPHTACKPLMVQELMAMFARPLLSPYLPEHAWCLNNTPHLPGIEAVEALARSVDHDTRRHAFMFWNLGVEGDVVLGPLHVKMIVNMMKPYVPQWWVENLFKLYTFNKGSNKTWTITRDECSSLPAVLVDILLLRLDFSEVLEKHPLWEKMSQLIKSDKKKHNLGVIKPRQLPKKIDESADLDYHRLGPVIAVAFRGPEKLREKFQRAVELELKSGLLFDKRFIDNKVFSFKPPRGKKKKKDSAKEAEYALKYMVHQKTYDIAAAGTKPTRNRARTLLQEEGRQLVEAQKLHKPSGAKAHSKRAPKKSGGLAS